ncbi:MAG: AI-2E family transporter [Hyphomicrobiaceae bacterium]
MTSTARPKNGHETAAGSKGARAAEPQPRDPLTRASQVALIGLFVLALLWCAYVGRPVIVPVVLAWVIATIVLPIVKWMQAHRVPHVAAAVGVTLALALLIVLLLSLLSTPIGVWLGRASEIGVLLQDKLRTMNQPLVALEEIRKTLNTIGAGAGTGATLKVEAQSDTMVATIFSVVTPAVSQFVLCIGALVFYLVYQQRLRNALVYFLRDRDSRLATLRALRDIDEQMTTYFGTFTLVNFCLGIVTAGLAWAVGLPNPLLWGVLAGVLNYVPYIGPAVVVGTLMVAGLLTFPTLTEAVVAPLIFLAIVCVEGQFLTPALMGRRLELNPFAVFLAVAFCTWLWGPVGAFVAVPLLIALSVTLSHALVEQKPELPE